MARPAKPVEQLKRSGTFRPDRHAKRETAEKQLTILPTQKLVIPKDITDKKVRKAYRQHIDFLRTLNMEQSIDQSELDLAYLCLQKAGELRAEFIEKNALDEDFVPIMNRMLKLYAKYQSIAARYFVSPQSRLKLALDALSAKEKEQNIEKQTPAGKLLAKKES